MPRTAMPDPTKDCCLRRQLSPGVRLVDHFHGSFLGLLLYGGGGRGSSPQSSSEIRLDRLTT